MKKVTYIFVIITLIFLTACGSPHRHVNMNEAIQNKDIFFVAPSPEFQINKTYSASKYSTNSKWLKLIDFNKKGMQFKMYTSGFGKSNNKYFKRNSYYDDSDIREDVFTKRDRETNVTYQKSWITYVKGIKCQGFVFSRGFGGSYAPFSSKSYSLLCGYYDRTETKNNGKRFLKIKYIYVGDPKHNYEQELKQAVKKAISTLKIKNMDTARMKREGLLYPHKKFKSTKW